MNRYSGGLTVEDLRHAWVLYQSQKVDERRFPNSVIETLSAEWHRSPKSCGEVLSVLRRIHRGIPRGYEKSTIYNMTPAERHFVFTGELPSRPPVAVATFVDISADPESTPAATAPAATSEDLFQLLHDASHGTLPEIRDLLRELVSITSRAWGTPDE